MSSFTVSNWGDREEWKAVYNQRDYEGFSMEGANIYSVDWLWSNRAFYNADSWENLTGCRVWAVLYVTNDPYEVLSGNTRREKYHACVMEFGPEEAKEWYKEMYGDFWRCGGFDDDEPETTQLYWGWRNRRRSYTGDNMEEGCEEGALSSILRGLYSNMHDGVTIGPSLYGDDEWPLPDPEEIARPDSPTSIIEVPE